MDSFLECQQTIFENDYFSLSTVCAKPPLTDYY